MALWCCVAQGRVDVWESMVAAANVQCGHQCNLLAGIFILECFGAGLQSREGLRTAPAGQIPRVRQLRSILGTHRMTCSDGIFPVHQEYRTATLRRCMLEAVQDLGVCMDVLNMCSASSSESDTRAVVCVCVCHRELNFVFTMGNSGSQPNCMDFCSAGGHEKQVHVCARLL